MSPEDKAALERSRNAISTAQRSLSEADAAIESVLAPAPAQRPDLPDAFAIAVDQAARLTGLTWGPLSENTPGVEVHRLGRNGWKSLSSTATRGWRDSPPVGQDTWVYRIRGFNDANAGGTEAPKASPWSAELAVRFEAVPKPEPVPPGFNALACWDNDAATNKLVRLPALRQGRSARLRVETLGDIRADDWVTGDEVVWSDKESVVPKGYSQWSSNLHKGELKRRGGSLEWRNIGVGAEPDARQLKWGTREYNAPERIFTDCDFTEIPQEHGLYVSNSADTTLDGCTFLRVGSQGAQWAYRPLPYQQYGADNMPYESRPIHIVKDSHFVDCAKGGTRPSFNLTYFSPGTSAFPGSILIQDSSFVCDWTTPRQDGKRSTGALVVTPSQGNRPLSQSNMMRSVLVKNSLFDFTAGDRSIVSIRSTDEVVFEDCAFIARDHQQPNITIDKDYGDLNDTKTQRITFRNCRARGGVKLKIMLARDLEGRQASVTHDIDCPSGELTFNGVTGLLV